jgi:hypothetical protein
MRIALWASRSLALLRASCLGVRVETLLVSEQRYISMVMIGCPASLRFISIKYNVSEIHSIRLKEQTERIGNLLFRLGFAGSFGNDWIILIVYEEAESRLKVDGKRGQRY